MAKDIFPWPAHPSRRRPRPLLVVNSLVDSRHVLAVNGCPVPLHPTGRSGEFVAGVRYKAWKPPSSLHPTLDVNAPLTFDILDTWAERSIGGCKYYVAHPGGLAYSTYPKNGLEAESRRNALFQPLGHSPGRQVPTLAHRSLESPLVLDLRLSRCEAPRITPELRAGTGQESFQLIEAGRFG